LLRPGDRRGAGDRGEGLRLARAPARSRCPMTVDAEFWARLLGIVVIDLTLAGDNALVIAMAVRSLPRRQQTLGRMWGTAGAVGLRLAFIAIATFLLKIPGLQLLGGL